MLRVGVLGRATATAAARCHAAAAAAAAAAVPTAAVPTAAAPTGVCGGAPACGFGTSASASTAAAVVVPAGSAEVAARTVLVPLATTRAVVGVRGPQALTYVQGLTTNDVRGLTAPNMGVFAAFLTGKGRTMFEAVIVRGPDTPDGNPTLWLDTGREQAAGLAAHLRRFKLRAKVEVVEYGDAMSVSALVPTAPLAFHGGDAAALSAAAGALAAARAAVAPAGGAAVYDPRTARLGCRVLAPAASPAGGSLASLCATAPDCRDYTAARMLAGVPEGSEVADVIPLEWNLTFLNGVSLHKGCYVGQELVARAHFRGLVRKRFVPVLFHAPGAAPAPIAMSDPLSIAAAAAAAAASSTPAGALSLAVPGFDRNWTGSVEVGAKLAPRGSGDAAAAAAAAAAAGGGEGAEPEARIGSIAGWARGTNVGLAMVRLEHISHTLPPKPEAPATPPPADDADVAEPPAPFAGDAYLDDVSPASPAVAALSRLHDAAGSRAVEFAVGDTAVTPLLPPYWHRIAVEEN